MKRMVKIRFLAEKVRKKSLKNVHNRLSLGAFLKNSRGDLKFI